MTRRHNAPSVVRAGRHTVPLLVLALPVALCMFVPSSSGEDRNGDGVDDGANDGPAPTVRTLSGRATCTQCEPEATRVELVFDRDVRPEAVAGRIETAPFVALRPMERGASQRVVLEGDFAATTEYTLRLASGVDVGTGRTSENLSFTFTTGGPRPQLVSPYGERVVARGSLFPVLVENIESARVRVVRVDQRDLHAAASIASVHYDGDPVAGLPARLGRRLVTRTLGRGDLDAEHIAQIDVFDLAHGSPALVVVDAPGVPTRVSVFQRADLALTLKVGPASGLVWVVDPATGRPAAGTAVRVYEGPSVRFSGTTDASGILRLPAEARLRRSGEDPWDRPPLRAVAIGRRSQSYTSDQFSTGIESWQFGVPYSHGGTPESFRGMVTAERGIYRPGETVHLLGVLRRRAPNGRLVPPRGNVDVTVIDPDGGEVTRESVRVTTYGTFRLEVPIPRGSRLGSYTVSAARAGETDHALHHRFEVGEFRANTFEVDVPQAGDAELENGVVVVPIAARYLYGAPVRGGRVSYQISMREQDVRVPGHEAFVFTASHGYSSSARYLTGGDLVLDERGEGRIEMPRSAIPTGEGASQSVDLLVEATVTDEADDAVTARTVQSLTSSETLVGIRNERWVLGAGERWTVELLAVNGAHRPVAGETIDVTLHRRVWRTSAEAGAGGIRYDGFWDEVLVEERTVTSSAGPARVAFDVGDGGQYRIDARVGVLAPKVSTSVWVAGRDSFGPVENHPRIELVLDRASYDPGETARVFAMSPYAESLALVTIEREGVTSARTVRLRGTQTPIEVPVGRGELPNAFVGVTLLPIGLGEASPATGAPLRAGYAELRVSAASRKLEVEIRPTSRELEPGDEAEVVVRVRDAARRPVRAEVTVWAADEGVLALTGYRTPDPFAPAYAGAPLYVRTANNLTHWTNLDLSTWLDEGGDSGDGAAAGALRSRFLSTAFFSRGVVTGADGTARVRMRLPDNLTRWRVMGAAADRGERFGSGESSITVSKALQVMPSLPRFLTEGDVVDASVVVHNHTGRTGTARVSLEVEGAEIAGAHEQSVELEDGAQRSVRFSVRTTDIGAATFRARAVLGGDNDGFELSIPIHSATAWSTVALGDGRVEGTASVDVAMPRDAKPGSGELTITVSPSVLASLEAGMKSLLEYPNGCLEQTTSRLIPMVLLEDLVQGSETPMLSSEEHRRRMDAAIEHVLRHQNEDGGFGLWPTSSSEGFLTAYGLWGLMTAREHGYAVPTARLDRALAYLRAHTSDGADMHGQFNDEETRPFAAYVLARAEQPDAALGTSLAAREASLSRFSVGLLANAVGTTSESTPLYEALARAEVAGREGRMIDESGGAEFLSHGRDLRATSSAVQALVASGRAAEAEDLVAGILAERDGSGTWGSTYNNLWALYALSSYARAVEQRDGPTVVTIRLGAEELGTVRVGGARRIERIVVPASRLPAAGASARLTLTTARGESARFSAQLRHAVGRASQTAEQHGLSVTRELLDAETGAVVTSPRVGQILRVRLTVTGDTDLRQVAVTDRLPAGLEPIDTSLETSTRRARDDNGWEWTFREMHDERVSFFADYLQAGTHSAEYLARASRAGELIRPAATTEAMYDPRIWGRSDIERLTISR